MSTAMKHVASSSKTEESHMVGKPSEIRDIVYKVQGKSKYFVLAICAKHFRIFSGSDHELVEMKTSVPDNILAYKNDIPEKVTNFSDASGRKETMLDKFLLKIDHELTRILAEDNVPVFVIATKRTAGHFKKVSHNDKNIVEYVHGNYDEATVPELTQLMRPHVAILQKIRVNNLVKQLEHAMDAQKLVWGIHEVWRYVMQNKGKLMVVEDNYYFPSNEDGSPVEHYELRDNAHPQYYLKDAVDVLIERVLNSGGKVEFVEKGVLDNYGSIALIPYY